MAELSELTAVSPIDGRYRSKVVRLEDYLSEYGLIKARVGVEGALLIALTSGVLPDVPKIDDKTRRKIQKIVDTFSVEEAEAIKTIEAATNHDVKAVELWLRSELNDDAVMGNLLELIHFGVTSEDINNNAYNLTIAGATKEVIIPALELIIKDLSAKAVQYADMPMIGETHGQPATPTTIGKEIRVFVSRLEKATKKLQAITLSGKLNGATGTYGAMLIAYPEVDWPAFSKTLIEALGFEFNGVTTQIEPHDMTAEIFDQLSRINGIIKDASMDIWEYISRSIFVLKPKDGEVGSSTMPHKVNPIDFENAEGQAGLSTALFRHMADKLVVSRLQRDLSDSTVFRSTGEGFAHMLIALTSFRRGLGKIDADPERARLDLEQEWAILAEAIQTVGRRYGEAGIYDKIKLATRGKPLDKKGYLELVKNLSAKIPNEARQRLAELTPSTYVGLASKIAKGEIL